MAARNQDISQKPVQRGIAIYLTSDNIRDISSSVDNYQKGSLKNSRLDYPSFISPFCSLDYIGRMARAK